MSTGKETQETTLIVVFLITVFTVIALFEYLIVNQFYSSSNALIIGAIKSVSKDTFRTFRVFYLLSVIGSAFLLPTWRIGKESLTFEEKIILSLSSAFCGIFVIIGYTQNSTFYNYFIFPLFFILYVPLITRLITNYKKAELLGKFFKGISNITSEFQFEYMTISGQCKVHCPEQATFIDGGPGSGKSHYLIKFMLLDVAKYQRPGAVYDYEGDPTKKDNPILTKIVYSAIEHQRKLQPNYILNFAFINFTDMCRTTQVNLLSERYYDENNAQLFIMNLASTLMKNLEPAWKEKTDFWAGNAINFVFSVMYLLYKNHRNENLNTIPHAISVCLEDSDTVFRWIEKDAEVSKMMASMLTAWRLGAQQQTAGAVSSAQLPLIKLFKKNIYWVLSNDVLDLDITNKEKPTLLCVGNSPSLSEAISPAISSILSVVMSQMNSSGKAKAVFIVDELPTIILMGLDKFLNTVRKHGVATVLAVQDFAQLVRDYGKDSASIIRTGCGNYFQGMTGNNETTAMISDMLGEINEKSVSITTQESGGGSKQESEKKEKILHRRDIASQKAGHFFVKIANGEPAFAFTQFEPFHLKNNIEISEIPMSFAVDNIKSDAFKNWSVEEKILFQQKLVANRFKRINDQVNDLLKEYKKKDISETLAEKATAEV